MAEVDILAQFKDRLAQELPKLRLNDEPISLWGVSVEDFALPQTDVILLKFLRARELKIEDATRMFVDCVKWRRESKIDSIMDEEFPASFKSLGYIYKADKLGRPVCVNFYGGIDSKKIFEDNGGIDKFVRWRIQLMEKGIHLLKFDAGIDSMIQIHDYAGVKPFAMDKYAKAASKAVIGLFNAYYPELMFRKFFVNVPWFMASIFNLLTPLVSQRTRSKFVVCSSSAVRSTLLQYIDAANLPPVYTGVGAAESSDVLARSGATQEFVVAPRSSHEVVLRAHAGQHLVYHWMTYQQDVGFSMSLRPDVPSHASTTVLVPHVRATAHAGDLPVPGEGEVVLLWDNSFSWRNPKTIVCATALVDGARPPAHDT